jgi:hypothetical protein
MSRMADLGFHLARVPIGKMASEPHVPILVTKNLATAPRIVVVLNMASEELAFFSCRIVEGIGRGGIKAGTAEQLTARLMSYKDDPETAIVIANNGSLIWDRKGSKAVTRRAFSALPRKTAISEHPRLTAKNFVEENKFPEDHTRYILDQVIRNHAIKDRKVDVQIIANVDAAYDLLMYLDETCKFVKT